jgi:hypothetical protein
MATLWVREYSLSGYAKGRRAGVEVAPAPLPIPAEPGTDQSAVTFSTSAQSAAFAADTTYIAIIGSAAFHYLVGKNPTATTGALKVPADTLVYLAVNPGDKIAAIAAS